MARFRASCYFDITADTEEQAATIAQGVANHLGKAEYELPPEGYYNPYIGGVARLTGDLTADADRLKRI